MRNELLSQMYRQHFVDQYEIGEKGVRPIGHRRNFDTTIAKVTQLLVQIDPSISQKDLEDFVMDNLPRSGRAHTIGFTDIDDTIAEFTDYAKIKITAEQVLYRRTMQPASIGDMQNLITRFCWEKNLYLSKEDTAYNPKVLFDSFKDHLKKLEQRQVYQLQQSLRHRPCAEMKEMMRDVLTAIGAAPDEETYKINATMLAHWMWTVKRRALLQDYRPSLPLMLVFAGPQGCGKSSFLETLLSAPMAGKVLNTKLDMIHDSREIGKFTQNIIVNFDELSISTSKGDTAEVLKNLITLDSVQSRIFHTQDQTRLHILATFAATTNKHLSEVVRDETGARRYWVIDVHGHNGSSQFDWDVLESVDYLKLWQAIDEGRKTGYFSSNSPMYPRVSEIQDTFCISPIVRDWLNEFYYIPDREYETYLSMHKLAFDRLTTEERPRALTILSQGSLYENYVRDMTERNTYTCNPIAFHRMMEKMGVRTVIESPKHKAMKYYMLLDAKRLHEDEDQTETHTNI